MPQRQQRTLARSCVLRGVGFFTGADVELSFHPAEEQSGIRFQRTDCSGTPAIPADLGHAVNCHRRTGLAGQGVQVTMIEHVMAALAGLQIDNCLVRLNAPEPPGFDGSSQPMVDALLDCGFVTQSAQRACLVLSTAVRAGDDQHVIHAEPDLSDGLRITYELDYGLDSPIPAQCCTVELSPQTFLEELAGARTFILESEVAALRAQGYGSRITARDLLVFGADGVLDNALRWPDECARHKVLDCVGDFALLGCDLRGHVHARKSGHALNQAAMHAVAECHRELARSADSCRDAA